MTTELSSPADKLVTGEALAQMPDSKLYELLDGRVVPINPIGEVQGGIEANFAEALKRWVRQSASGRVRSGEVGVYTRRNPDRVRAADALFISDERYALLTSRRYLDVAPDLIVEILSPDDTMQTMTQKLREYFAIDVRLVWVADPAARVIYAYRALTNVREFAETDMLTGDEVLPGFSVPVAQLFED